MFARSWNESQVFWFQEVAKAFVHVTMLSVSLRAIESGLAGGASEGGGAAAAAATVGQSEARGVMLHLWRTAALGLVVSHIDTYLEGGHITGAQSRALKAMLLAQLRQLRPHSLALVNVVAPPDWVVWSPLGLKANHPTTTTGSASAAPGAAPSSSATAPSVLSHSSDQTYDNYFHAITHFQQTYERAPYWRLLRDPLPIVGQAGGRFASTQPQQLRLESPEARTNSTGRAKL